MNPQMVLLSTRSSAPVLATAIGDSDPFAGKRAVLWTDDARVYAGRASISGSVDITSYPFAEMLVVTEGTLRITHAGQVRTLSAGMSAAVSALAEVTFAALESVSWCFTATLPISMEPASSDATAAASQDTAKPSQTAVSTTENSNGRSIGDTGEAATQALSASSSPVQLSSSSQGAQSSPTHASSPSNPQISAVFMSGSEELQPSPPPAPDALTTPAPTCGAIQPFSDPTTGLSAGIWSATPYARHVRLHAAHEMMHVIEGGMTLTNGAELTLSLEKGDTVFVPKDAPCGWESTVPMRKFFAGA